eukprot:10652833-Ditylum_brightwellii.AAC.2
MSSNSTKKLFVVPTPESTKVSTPDSSKNFAKSTNKNGNNTPALSCTVITPQNDKENTRQADINSTSINKPLNLPSESLHMTPIASQRSNSTTTGVMISCNTNSGLPLSQEEHTQVSVSEQSDSKQSSNKPSTKPTNKSTPSDLQTAVFAKLHQLEMSINT